MLCTAGLIQCTVFDGCSVPAGRVSELSEKLAVVEREAESAGRLNAKMEREEGGAQERLEELEEELRTLKVQYVCCPTHAHKLRTALVELYRTTCTLVVGRGPPFTEDKRTLPAR